MLPKHQPERAGSSTGGFAQSQNVPVGNSAQVSDQDRKRRFREAYMLWRERTGGTQELFADELGEPWRKVKGWFSDDPFRAVPLWAVQSAEGLSEFASAMVGDRELAIAARELYRAWNRMLAITGRAEDAA